MVCRNPKGTPAGGQFAAGRRPEGGGSLEDPEWRQTPAIDRPELLAVLESAAKLQEAIPDAVLVGGSAAALWADHRESYDHDHVLADLSDRFEMVLEAVESQGEWVTNRVTPGKIILGELGGIESGVRQLIRTRPLETIQVTLPSGHRLTVPTPAETLRVKAYLAVRRNQTRDYLDVAALAHRFGVPESARVLSDIDAYYEDQRGRDAAGVASQVARQLADPRPRDIRTTTQLEHYKGLDRQWTQWNAVVAACRAIALQMAARP